MKIMSQIMMVMNLDKCIGCHTCSVTCKQAWTNREGTEYVWFNNVETRPGVGYPRTWEDQNTWKGGWTLDSRGALKPRAGGRWSKLATIFANPNMPTVDDYYEPWTYDYDKLLSTPAGAKATPVAQARSSMSATPMKQIKWGPNWDDNLGGSVETLDDDPVLTQMNLTVKKQIEDTFMFYLPRICNHCVNPTCVAACPSGAMYKRVEDGIVLVDQQRCRGWRMCISGCPYKKVYFNHKTGKAEKCTLCYPRLEMGEPTICSEKCVGRLRYLGVVLYDADQVEAAASVENEQELYYAQRDMIMDPWDGNVIAHAKANGVPRSFIEAAQNSPVYRLIKDYRLALPLHPEYRTLPMVWYIPPLSPVVEAVTASGANGEDHKVLLTALSTMRIPLDYLAGLFTAGDTRPVELALRRLGAMRCYMRDINLGNEPQPSICSSVGVSEDQIRDMYRLLSIAKYKDRYVIPTSHPESQRSPMDYACPVDDQMSFGGCSTVDFTSSCPMSGSASADMAGAGAGGKGTKVPVQIGRRPC